METVKVRGISINHYPPTGEDKKAAVICAHGFLSSHIELGTVLPERLAAAGFHVYLYDHPGHGESDGARGYVDLPTLWGAFWEVHHFIRSALNEKNLKIFGMGHSLGSIPVLMHADNLSGAILVGPPSRLDYSLNALERVAYPLLYYGVTIPLNFLANMLGISWEVKIPYKFCKENLFSEREYIEHAKLDLSRFVPGRTYPLTKADNVAMAKKRRAALLILVGGKDTVTGVAQSQEVFEALLSKDKRLRIFDRSGHSVFQDHDGAALTQEIETWLKEHL